MRREERSFRGKRDFLMLAFRLSPAARAQVLMKSVPDSRDFRSGWYARADGKVGRKGVPRSEYEGDKTRCARPGNATLASSRYVCWWRFHISSGYSTFSEYPAVSRAACYPSLPMSIGEFASSAYRHSANTRRNALACMSMSVDVRAYTRIDVFDSQATLARCWMPERSAVIKAKMFNEQCGER